jgi:hypothetical protein
MQDDEEDGEGERTSEYKYFGLQVIVRIVKWGRSIRALRGIRINLTETQASSDVRARRRQAAARKFWSIRQI